MTTTTDAIEVRSPTSATSAGSRSSRSTWPRGHPSPRRTRSSPWSRTGDRWTCPRRRRGHRVQRLAVSVGTRSARVTSSSPWPAATARPSRSRHRPAGGRRPAAGAVAGGGLGRGRGRRASAQAAPAAAPAPAPAGPSRGQRRPGRRPRRPQRAPPGPRAGDRPLHHQGHRREGPHHQGGPCSPPSASRPGHGPGGPPARASPDPAQDFSKFGPVETQPLPRIKRISEPFLHRSTWASPTSPHNDEADITELDAYRKELDTAAKAEGYRVTLLAFLMKAAVSTLQAFPEVNSSLSPEKDSLILKSYYHISIADRRTGGLVVPVIRDVDRKGVTALSKELGEVSGGPATAS